jgi:two-component system, NarL family, nitrate/nitrite response regulator NarL
MIAARRVTVDAPILEQTPLVALRLRDEVRRRALETALPTAPEAEADVLVLDLRAGEAVPRDVAAFDGAVLVLSDDPLLAADAALAGVLPAGASERQVAAAVAALAEGLTVRTPALRDTPGFAARDPAARPLLTPREVEVLALVGQGMSNKAIARRLAISAHTVKYHLEAIFAKLGVRSRAEAVTRGLRLGVHVL